MRPLPAHPSTLVSASGRTPRSTSSVFRTDPALPAVLTVIAVCALIYRASRRDTWPGSPLPLRQPTAHRFPAPDLFSSLFLADLLVAQFASGITAQASTSRLLYAMGRDSVLPRPILGDVHPRYHAPAVNILLPGAVGLIALHPNVATSTSFINFGAFIAFIFVNLAVITTYFRKRRAGEQPGLLGYVIAPTIGAAVDLWLMANFEGEALVLGTTWLALGVFYLAYVTRGFRNPPPELTFEEEPIVVAGSV